MMDSSSSTRIILMKRNYLNNNNNINKNVKHFLAKFQYYVSMFESYDYDHHHHDHHQHSIRYRSSSSLLSLTLMAILIFICPLPFFADALNPLNEHIIHYETLNYDPQPHLNALDRSRRSAKFFDNNNNENHQPHHHPLYAINFHSHGRNLSLRLKRDIDSVFHRNLIVEDGDGQPLQINLDHIVSGHLNNQPNSLVYGSINDGIFVGKIHSTVPNEETFYVEKASKYFQPDPIDIYLLDGRTLKSKYNYPDLVKAIRLSKTTSTSTRLIPALPFHSVIYSSKHVKDPFHDQRSPIDGGCGTNEEVREWMNSIANSAVSEDEDEIINNNSSSTSTNDPNRPVLRSKRASINNISSNKHYDYGNYRRLFEAQGRISNNRPLSPHHSTPYLPSKRACSLYIQTDTFLWDHVKKHESEKSDFKVREEIASLVAQHIKAVNHIYETSVFKNIIGLKFIVQRLRINDSSACEPVKRESNQFCSPNIDVSNFLNLNSQFNHNDFCLAYIFTYRDFSGGTLGLAWVASTSGASGGICEKYKTYTENIGGRQVQTKRSLNTGIITFVNYNSRVPPKVSELTLAHEIGHNFGSPHDYPVECRPGGPLGNYIMYSSATSGERQNNNKFSQCSVNNISTVLNAVFNNEGKENCFQEDNGPFCGNKIVEDGEECDCGYDSRECNEDCCYPRSVEEFKHLDPHAQPCRRRPGASCSPSEGPCCTERCTFEGNMKQCRDDGECTYESFCSGQRAHCPLPPAKPNKTECNMGTQVCWQGSCTGSICQKYDLEECFLNTRRGAKPEEMCEVACQRRNQPETCRRTSEIDIMRNISGMKLRPGSPCNDFQGYCDVFQRCRPVDAEGPLAKLKNLLFNKKTLISIKQWVTTYWWACMLMLFAAILFMAAFIKCCAVHTPSSNPKLKKALRISDTLRRPADTLRRKSRERSQQQHASSGGGHHQLRGGRNPNHHHGRSGGNRQNGPSRLNHNPSTSATTTAGASHQSQSSSNMMAAAYQQSTNVAQSTNPSSTNITTTFPPTLVVNLPPPVPKDIIMEPPPPYPGLSTATSSSKPSAPPLNIVVPVIPGAPSHGYGEGRGHYNRQQNSAGPTSVTASAAAPSSSKGSKERKNPETVSKSHRR